MSEKNDGKSETMTVTHLQQILAVVAKEAGGNFEVWLSCDEEGNEFLPMSKTIENSLGIDKEGKRIILFPLHR